MRHGHCCFVVLSAVLLVVVNAGCEVLLVGDIVVVVHGFALEVVGTCAFACVSVVVHSCVCLVEVVLGRVVVEVDVIV